MVEAPSQSTTETAGFLATGTPLYVVFHAAHVPARGVVVLVPPFAEEKKAAQRALVEAARAWAEQGFDVWRFDLRGTGDSGGTFGEADISAWLADVRAVLSQARAAAGERPLHLAGLRLGATLAWLAAKEFDVDGLVLWEPILSGATYMRQNRQRSSIRSQLTSEHSNGVAAPQSTLDRAASEFAAFDFDGFWINEKMHRELAEIDLLNAPLPSCRKVLCLQISGSSRLKKPLLDLQARLEGAQIPAELENVSVEAFWSAIGLVDTAPVRDRTAQWLNQSTLDELQAPSKYFEGASSAIVQDGVTAETLSFQSGDQRVQGVLYRPEGEVERAVILLHGWSGYRIGPGHLLTEAARELAAAGYAAYSFDFRGRGESEWEVGQASLNSMIRDACRAVPLVLDKTGASKATLLGLCSGAEVALGAGLSDARIDTLALWSAPIFSGAFTTARQLRRGRESAKKYWQKLFVGETWSKLLTGRVNFKMVLRALSGGRSNEDAAVKDKAPDTAGQMKEFEAFSGRLLFVYAGSDPETEPSRDFYRAFVERTQMPHEFHEIAGANHNYYSVEWKREIIQTTRQWLRDKDKRKD